MRETRTIRPQLALEMTMRDVLGNMEELATEYAFRDTGGDFEILAIEPAIQPSPLARDSRAPRHRELFSAAITPFVAVNRQVA
jgi:hypothetical protein